MIDAAYKRSYDGARAVLSVLEKAGWGLIALGLIGSLYGFANAESGWGETTFSLRLLAAAPGFSLALGGLLAAAFARVGQARVDTAEWMYEIFGQSPPITPAASPAAADAGRQA